MIINPIIKSFIKITILTLVFFVFFYLWSQFIHAWWWSNDEKTTNLDNFESVEDYSLSEVWVALNINVWTKFYEWKKDGESNLLYNDIVTIATIKSDRNQTNEILITKNMESIRDYINIAKIDIKSYLDSSADRKDNYESLLNQLKIRYKIWYANSKNLNTQIELIVNHLNSLETSIENIKSSMKINMKSYNSKWLSKNINDYITVKNESTMMKVYLLFCSRFQAYYNFLNAYNKEVITTLRLNQDAIIKNAYVVVPENWSDLIQKLNLIYNESELPESTVSSSSSDTTAIDNWNITSSENGSSSFYFDTDSPFSAPWNWIFWDPFNLKNWTYETIKADWQMKFWTSKYINNN